MDITNEDLIKKAFSIIKPVKRKDEFAIGECGTALVTELGNFYFGVSMGTSSGIGFCSEQSAIASMVTNGEYRIKKIVAVLEDGTIVPPCGLCREFIYQVDKNNLETDVIISKDKTIKIKELLPHPWDENL